MSDAPRDDKVPARAHVLPLSAESANVRQIARSWATGEMSIDDYRMIRSLTIEGMLSGEISMDPPAVEAAPAAEPDDFDDDHDVTEVGDHTVAEHDDTDPNVQQPAPVEQAPAPAVPRAALIAGGILLLVGVILLLTLL